MKAMMFEGKGLIPPPPVVMKISSFDCDLLRRVAEDREARRGYSASTNHWKRGLIHGSTYVSPTYVGLMGEQAFTDWLIWKLKVPVSPDLEYRVRGDRGIDLIFRRIKFQIKTET